MKFKQGDYVMIVKRKPSKNHAESHWRKRMKHLWGEQVARITWAVPKETNIKKYDIYLLDNNKYSINFGDNHLKKITRQEYEERAVEQEI